MNELIEFSLDTENQEKNYNLALWYDQQGHTAPAHTYYLRAAERTEDKLLSYTALIRASFCYKKQGSRDSTEKILLENALNLLPQNPEAYYFLSLLYEKNGDWRNCYTYANLGLHCYQKEITPINISEYTGKELLLFQKAVSSWHWGKGDESRELFQLLFNEYYNIMDEKHQKLIDENMNRFGLKRNQKILKDSNNYDFYLTTEKKSELLSDIFDSKKYNTDKDDLGYIDNFYNPFFKTIKDIPINFMEIGVAYGASILLWKDYLHVDSKIYAADINYFDHVKGTYSIIGDMYTNEQCSKFSNEYFDVIIDDGLHNFESFVLLMQRYYSKLKKGGVLIIEDIIVSSWVEPLSNLSNSLGYFSCEIIDMTGKQKTQNLLDLWKDGLYILKLTK